jgi:signal transduction histidine kinase
MTGLALQNARLVQQQMKTARLAATGETVAYLSHNIKNILQAMQAGEDLVDIGLEKKNFTALRHGWRIVQRNLDRIMQMTMNMLNFSKTREPNLQQANLSQVVGDAAAGLQKKADERKVTLVLDLEEPFPPIPLDADGITQVALNIIDNALEAVIPESGVVTVATRFHPEEGIADFTVSDNGPGIEPDKIKEIFEPFTSSKGQGGTGLGLAVARKIVREHHGRTIVESTPGQGTIFRIRLPAQEMHGASEETYSTLD